MFSALKSSWCLTCMSYHASARRFWSFRKLELGRIALEYPPNLRTNTDDVPEKPPAVEMVDEDKVHTVPSLDIGRGDYEGW